MKTRKVGNSLAVTIPKERRSALQLYF
ncbi:AbrB/MazE/SpoVT family DNA-binding domain-containing protein [Streptococcus suis]